MVNTGKQITGKIFTKSKLITATFWTTENELAKRIRQRLGSKVIEVQLTQGAHAEKLVVEDNELTIYTAVNADLSATAFSTVMINLEGVVLYIVIFLSYRQHHARCQ